MCGKFTQMMSWGTLVRLYRIHEEPEERAEREAREGDGEDDRVEASTPMRPAWILVLDDQKRRRRVRMRWGFTSTWKKDERGNPERHIHARCETIDRMPAFKDAFTVGRRGILIVRTFNEAKKVTDTKYEQQVLTPKDGKQLGIAVIWNYETQPDGTEILVYCMVTTPPNRQIGEITERMPAVLPEVLWDKWLGAEPATLAEIKDMLTPYEGEWDMAPQDPPKPPRPPKPPALRKTTKPSQGSFFS